VSSPVFEHENFVGDRILILEYFIRLVLMVNDLHPCRLPNPDVRCLGLGFT